MRLRTDRRLLTVLLLCLLVASGCAELNAVEDLSARISAAGYHDVKVIHSFSESVDPNFDGVDTVIVYAFGGPDGGGEEEVARMVWDTYPAVVDALNLTTDGGKNYRATAAELETRFGPREVEFDPNIVLKWTVGIAAFLLVLFGGVVVLVIVLVLRYLRRQAARTPQYPHTY
ncbi:MULTISPECIES: hypothetical protein [unclassified Saccharothrix]|uniref:hypothetical protein n=1 Tax=unclassified Saccharothrix TaxID=2593673 RepID=UPI00307DF05E